MISHKIRALDLLFTASWLIIAAGIYSPPAMLMILLAISTCVYIPVRLLIWRAIIVANQIQRDHGAEIEKLKAIANETGEAQTINHGRWRLTVPPDADK